MAVDIRRVGVAVGASQDLEKFGSPEEGVPGGQVGCEQLEDGWHPESSTRDALYVY